MITIDLNADIGEGFGAYEWGSDETLLEYVSSANIACGFHAGDPHTMSKTVESCLKHGVAIGAHPGLPDRLGFGRREMAVTPEEAGHFVLYQVGALQSFVRAYDGRLQHVKLHGALYHMAARDEQMAQTIVKVIRLLEPELLLYGPSGSCLHAAADSEGIRFISEGFADRAYMPDGSLVPRHLPGAVIENTESAVNQAVSLARAGQVQTLCLHGDTPKAKEHAEQIAHRLRSSGVSIQPPGRI
ncbi:LamB/YcsF family protein [Cohnella silvisoli]|uniref:5-oxoprolinase subunit PxpA n=1 Tax=Cohnella silvisoli TaxID=2873699 RepID=A0ABV1KXJ3_9BACL|nr:5-oxoprolinase subunit PxpA [Cohnella silvisoli]MCD9024178.1 LamB/YcsF family protein [Cohnella silvisoli]